jgi:hypothetical protein
VVNFQPVKQAKTKGGKLLGKTSKTPGKRIFSKTSIVEFPGFLGVFWLGWKAMGCFLEVYWVF